MELLNGVPASAAANCLRAASRASNDCSVAVARAVSTADRSWRDCGLLSWFKLILLLELQK